MRILVVEDRKDIQKYYARGLERSSVAFDIVDSRVEAIEMLNRYSYQGAIVDLQLTDDESYSQGIEVLRYIQNINEGTKVFVVSGTPHVQDVINSYETGAFKVIAKADKNYVEIAMDLVKDCQDIQLKCFGFYPNLNSYLAAPEHAPMWEDQINRTLSCGYPKLQKLLRSAFKGLLPVLRLKNEKDAFFLYPEQKSVLGKFWSKNKGFSISVQISESPAVIIQDKQDIISQSSPVNGYSVTICRENNYGRADFYKIIDELNEYYET